MKTSLELSGDVDNVFITKVEEDYQVARTTSEDRDEEALLTWHFILVLLRLLLSLPPD